MLSGILTQLKVERWWKLLLGVLWAVTMIGLPLTSFPLLTRLTGATVAPFSAIPIFLLCLLFLLPYILKRGSLPRETVPLIVFILFTIALAAYAFFEVNGYFRNRPLLSTTIRTFIPVMIGIAFFLTTSAWHADSQSVRRTLQYINVGGFLMLAFAVAQAVVVFRLKYQYPPAMTAIMNLLVAQAPLEGTPRLAGLTWEPSWFAHELNMLYLPLWLAATYQRTSVFPRLWKISVENIFLAVGLVVFFLTSSRIGFAGCALMFFFLFLKLNLALYRRIVQILSRIWVSFARLPLLKLGVGLVLVVLFLSVYIGFGAGVFKLASQQDWRLKLILTSPLSQSDFKELTAFNEESLFLVGRRFAFLERPVYWITGWHIFNDFPILGVGLGNAGYYFVSEVPSIGYSTYEIRTVVYQNDSLPNTKSIWYRLLAETGLVGFSIFVVWLVVIGSSAQRSQNLKDTTLKTVALAGQLSLLAYVFEGFSVDTFGFPYLFVMAGMVAAIGAMSRRLPQHG